MDILSLTAVELAKAIREGKTTAVEATQAVLDRIAAGEDTYCLLYTSDAADE